MRARWRWRRGLGAGRRAGRQGQPPPGPAERVTDERAGARGGGAHRRQGAGDAQRRGPRGSSSWRSSCADSPDSPETAEALFKLAELTWEDAQADYLARMGRYQEQVARLQAGPAAAARELPAPAAAAGSVALAGHLPAAHPGVPRLPQAGHRPLPATPSPCATRAATPRRWRLSNACWPTTRARASGADAWMAVAEHRFYEQQDFAGAKRDYERVLNYPRSPLYRAGAVPDRLVRLEAGAAPRRRPPAGRRCWTWGRRPRAAAPRSRSGPPSCPTRRWSTWSSCSPRTTARPPTTPTASWPRSAARPIRSGCMRRFADTVYDQARYERAAEAYRFLIELDPKAPTRPMLQRRVVDSYQALGRADRAAAEMRTPGDRLRARAAPGPRPTPIAPSCWPRPRRRRGLHPHPGQGPARPGPAQREGIARRRQALYAPGGRVLRLLSGAVPRRQGRAGDALPARGHPVLQAGRPPGGRARVPGGGPVQAGRAPTTRRPC